MPFARQVRIDFNQMLKTHSRNLYYREPCVGVPLLMSGKISKLGQFWSTAEALRADGAFTVVWCMIAC